MFAFFHRGTRDLDDPGGTGVGLALVRKIARAAGGDAWAEKAPEGGALMVVRFPLAEEGGRP